MLRGGGCDSLPGQPSRRRVRHQRVRSNEVWTQAIDASGQAVNYHWMIRPREPSSRRIHRQASERLLFAFALIGCSHSQGDLPSTAPASPASPASASTARTEPSSGGASEDHPIDGHIEPASSSVAGGSGNTPPASSALTGYDLSCQSAADCVGVPVPPAEAEAARCTNCKEAAINRGDKPKYDAWVESLQRPPKICPCPPSFVACSGGTCRLQSSPP